MKDIENMEHLLRQLNQSLPGHRIEVILDGDGCTYHVYCSDLSNGFDNFNEDTAREIFVGINNIKAVEDFLRGAIYGVDKESLVE